jgi:ABC-type multidrug transport system fused ATPase/permease subunit
MLPDYFMQLLINVFWLGGMLAVCAASTPWFLVLYVPLTMLFVAVCKYFRPSSRELKRLEGVSRSPVFVVFDETLRGLSTIRAHGAQGAYLSEAEHRVEENVKTRECFMPKCTSKKH